jgi:molybdate transport repressor ModE-like protein
VAIERSGSLAAASREVGYSYRHVWNLLGDWNRRMGQPLVNLERGRGARLTPFAAKLVELEGRARVRLAPHLAELAREFERELYGEASARAPRLNLHASHDLALERLPDLLEGELALDLKFHGRLSPGAHKLIGLAIREQGLIVARGNPKGILGLPDLARLRFVNRQRGSGTRLVFDQLLARAGIPGDRISGYTREEFTHIAVATAVLEERVDVGFGIRAAAARFDLGFIPLVNERYLLACKAERLESVELRKLLATLRGKAFRAVLASLAGYDGAIAGRVMDVEEGLAGPRPARVAVRG